MTEHNLTAEEIAWLYHHHQFWDFNKIKFYGKAYGITEITLKLKNREITTIQV